MSSSEEEEIYSSGDEFEEFEFSYDDDLGQAKVEKKQETSALSSKIASGGSSVASLRLMGELQKLNGKEFKKFGYEIEIVGDNLYHWSLRLFDFPDDSKLYADLKSYGKKNGQGYVKMEILFPKDYPFEPPFIRVLSPRFQYLTGHITIGGSICMEALTRSGWIPTLNLENLLMQIKAEMVEGGARIDFKNQSVYSEREAREAFDRTSRRYGWN